MHIAASPSRKSSGGENSLLETKLELAENAMGVSDLHLTFYKLSDDIPI